jgi:hypothetical protein
MAIFLSTGAQVAIASTYGTASAVTAATNAAACVVTLAAGHGTVVGDFLEFTSGWDLATGRIFRASAVSTNDVTLEGLNTTSTSNYPTGGGGGSVRRITQWTPITQIQNIATSGGEQEFTDTTSIADRIRKQMPTTRSALEITITVFDDPSLGWYVPVQAASESTANVGIRFIMASGARVVSNGTWSLQEVPNINANTPLTAAINFSSSARSTRYAT